MVEQNLNGRLFQIVDELVRRGLTLEQARREFEHPRDGRVAYDQITFKPAHREDLKLVVLVREG